MLLLFTAFTGNVRQRCLGRHIHCWWIASGDVRQLKLMVLAVKQGVFWSTLGKVAEPAFKLLQQWSY
jgi:hypothetical protein